MGEDMLPLPSIKGVDEWLETMKIGALAGNALDVIKGTLTKMRDAKYRSALSAPDPAARLRLMDELKAIEALAQDLLAQEARGEFAHQQLMQTVGVSETRIDPAVLAPERTPPRKRPSRSKRGTAK